MSNYIDLYFKISNDSVETDDKELIIKSMTSAITNVEADKNLCLQLRYNQELQSKYRDMVGDKLEEKLKILGYLLSITSSSNISKDCKENIYYAIVNHKLGDQGNSLLFNVIRFEDLKQSCNKESQFDKNLFEKALIRWGDPNLINKYIENFDDAEGRISNMGHDVCANEGCLMPWDDIANVIVDITPQQLFDKNKSSSENLVQ